MRRLTKTYEDGTYAAADDLTCGENSREYKKLLLDKLGAYEDTKMTPEEIEELGEKNRKQKMSKTNPNT